MSKFQIKHRITGAVLFECALPGGMDFEREALQRIDELIEVSATGCWLLDYGLVGGYPRVTIGSRRRRIHQLLWELLRGPIPPGLLLRHTCDVRRCVNPAHLVLGTHQDNMDDMVSRGRTTRGRTLSAEHRRKVALSLLGRKRAAANPRAASARTARMTPPTPSSCALPSPILSSPPSASGSRSDP